MVLIWFSLQIDFLWQVDLPGIWFCPTETTLQLPLHLTMLLAIFSVFTLKNAFFPSWRGRQPGWDPKKTSTLTAALSPHPGSSERSLIWMLKLPVCLKFSVGGESGELPGEHGESCVCPSASLALGWWAPCWGWPAENKHHLLHSFKTWLELSVWSPSFRNNQPLKTLHQDLGDLGSTFFYHRWLWAHLLPEDWRWTWDMYGVPFGGGRAGKQESLICFCCSSSIAFWIKILQPQKHGSSSCWFRHSRSLRRSSRRLLACFLSSIDGGY